MIVTISFKIKAHRGQEPLNKFDDANSSTVVS